MHAPRLKEEETGALPDPVQHGALLHVLLTWVGDLLAERAPADTSIEWEDGEEHEELDAERL